MADYSPYKNLELPTSPEHYDIGVFNKNNMVIDSELHKLELKNQSQDELFATKEALNKAMAQSNQYTDIKLAQLIGDAPETLDTLKEVADAIEQNKIIVEALDVAIENKVNQTDILKSIESVNENTIEGKVADALVIKEVFQSVSNGKQLVASAITDKGINTEATDAFEIMAENIKNISSNKTDNDTLICNFYFNMNINLRAAEFKFYFPVKKSKKLIIKSLCLVGSKVREASNRNVYFQFYGKQNGRIIKITEFSGIIDSIGVKTVIDLEDTEIDISNFESLEYFYIYTPSVTLDYLYGFDLQSCIFELYI